MRGVTDPRVLAAMRKVPRDAFVPEAVRNLSYTDQPLPIGYDQTISQPYIVALMTEKLRLQPTDQVLEIGTGSGYQAAILAELAAQVYTIEIVAPLGERASGDVAASRLQERPRENRRRLRGLAGACALRCGDRDLRAGSGPTAAGRADEGRWAHHHPGRVQRAIRTLYLLEKKEGRLEQRTVLPVRFVPMTGKATRTEPNEAQPSSAPHP